MAKQKNRDPSYVTVKRLRKELDRGRLRKPRLPGGVKGRNEKNDTPYREAPLSERGASLSTVFSAKIYYLRFFLGRAMTEEKRSHGPQII